MRLGPGVCQCLGSNHSPRRRSGRMPIDCPRRRRQYFTMKSLTLSLAAWSFAVNVWLILPCPYTNSDSLTTAEFRNPPASVTPACQKLPPSHGQTSRYSEDAGIHNPLPTSAFPIRLPPCCQTPQCRLPPTHKGIHLPSLCLAKTNLPLKMPEFTSHTGLPNSTTPTMPESPPLPTPASPIQLPPAPPTTASPTLPCLPRAHHLLLP